MENIEDIRIEPCTKSRYVQPFRVLYKQVQSIALYWGGTVHLQPFFSYRIEKKNCGTV